MALSLRRVTQAAVGQRSGARAPSPPPLPIQCTLAWPSQLLQRPSPAPIQDDTRKRRKEGAASRPNLILKSR